MADGHEIVLHTRGLSKEYGKGAALVRAVDNVDLDVARGESVAIMGPSGCGKSTLLHMLGGLEHPSGGELWLGGQRIDKLSETALAKLRRHMIGFVFQGFHLIEELTAAENVEMPALLAGARPRAARRHALQLLDQVGLAERSKHLPSALSGGQRQRVRSVLRPDQLPGLRLHVLLVQPDGRLLYELLGNSGGRAIARPPGHAGPGDQRAVYGLNRRV